MLIWQSARKTVWSCSTGWPSGLRIICIPEPHVHTANSQIWNHLGLQVTVHDKIRQTLLWQSFPEPSLMDPSTNTISISRFFMTSANIENTVCFCCGGFLILTLSLTYYTCWKYINRGTESTHSVGTHRMISTFRPYSTCWTMIFAVRKA